MSWQWPRQTNLIVRCTEIAQKYADLLAEGDGLATVDPDLKERLKQCHHDLCQMTATFTKLRERCSQKMEKNISDCLARLKEIHGRVNAVELEAGLRAGLWFVDYGRRTQDAA